MFHIAETVLCVIDVQGKLAQLMHDRDRVLKNISSLIQMSKILSIPIIWTEQVPDKIGETVPEIGKMLSGSHYIKKISFSCWLNEDFAKTLKSLKRKQVLLCGIETHVCVYQTAVDLIEEKYEVEVVADAVSSRTEENKKLALDRISQSGARLTGTEMIATELMRTAEHEKFKDVLSLIK